MNFWESLKETNNRRETENGAIGYKTTGNALLDLNFSIPKLREMTESEIISVSLDALRDTDINLFLKWIFYVRDIRQGLGERKIFRALFSHIVSSIDDYRSKVALITLISEYGRWDDVLYLLNIPVVRDAAIVPIMDQLYTDVDNMKNELPVSLLGKWIPNINTHNPVKRELGRHIAGWLGWSLSKYRKTVSALRKYIDVVEVKMTNNEWDSINYNTVPSKANLLYSDAFMRHDEDRRSKWLEDLVKGKDGVKVNSGVSFPHEILYKLRTNSYDSDTVDLCNEMWKALPSVTDSPCRTIVLRDGSSSMLVNHVPGSNITAYDVATALTIYFAERMKGEFHNKFITFSRVPEEVDLNGLTRLSSKFEYCKRFNDAENTNIDLVFKTILKTAVYHKLKQEELPDTILIVSDMEFDRCVKDSSGYILEPRLFDEISDQYAAYCYKLPRLVFWNVSNRSGAIPMIKNDLGVVLVSGYSINIINMILSGKTDPMESLLDVLMSKRYEPVRLL